MRKWIVSLLITSLFLVMITTSQAATDGTKLGVYPKETLLVQSLNHENSRQLNQIIVLPKQQFNEREAAGIINRVNVLPELLLKEIKNQGITLKLFTNKLTDNPTASHLKGIVPRGYDGSITWDDVPGIGGGKVVLVKIGASEKGKGHGSINLELHELAHSIDHYIYDNISQKLEFREIWSKEHNRLFPNNNYFEYPEEYFAEIFAMYYLNTETRTLLQNKAPLSFELISSLD
jgi:Pro-Pro endopeptidase